MPPADSTTTKRRRGISTLPMLIGAIALLISFGVGVYFEKRNALPPPPIQPLSGNALRLITFNIRIDSASDGDNRWAYRRDAVASVIRFHQADIIGAQEASFDMIADLHERLPAYRWTGIGSNGGESGAADPIFWRDSRLELLSAETFWLSPTPQSVSTGWDAAFPRTVVYAHLRERETREELHVFNTHFDHRSSEAREHSAALVAARVNALPPEARVVFMGDLNCVPDSPPLQILQESTDLRDAFGLSLTGHFGPENSFMGFQSSRWTGRRIDHIYVRNMIVQQHGILADEVDGQKPSDHFPVLAEVILE